MVSNQELVWDYALKYHKEGFSLIPCTRDKKPALAWQTYTTIRASKNQLKEWFAPFEKECQSIGVVCGAISQNLVIVDLDGIPAIRQFASQFPKLCESTRSVLTGSQKGVHLYFRVKSLPDNANVRVAGIGGFELRGNGQYVIAPPSPHPSGHFYRTYRNNPIVELENLNAVYDWMQSLRENEQARRQDEISQAGIDVSVKTSKRKEAYLKKVFSEEIARVTTASEGQRNNSLFYAALRLANYAAGGELSWEDCKSALLLATDLKFSEAFRTVESAWKIGRKYPKRVK